LLKMIMQVGEGMLIGPGKFEPAEIYREYTKKWLGEDSHLVGFGTDEEKIAFIEDLAVSLLKSGSESLFIHEITDLEEKRKWGDYSGAVHNKEKYFDNKTRSFLLVNHDGSLMFSHRSLMEYFCAQVAIKLLRGPHHLIPPGDFPFFYSNLIIWFIRADINSDDYQWLVSMAKRTEPETRRLAFALLPAAVGSRKDKLIKFFQKIFKNETDMEAKRHIAYGIGWLGGSLSENGIIDYIEAHRVEWQRASFYYYYDTERQRQHCRSRLRSFLAGDTTYHGARGLYILDLEVVGKMEDIELIKPYTEISRENDSVVRLLASNTIQKIQESARSTVS
jgi:hypothetical protein